jgi:hypothetical protein
MTEIEYLTRDLAAQGKAICIGTSEGDVEVTEEDLTKATDEELAEHGIRMTREKLRQVYAEGIALMQEHGVKQSDRVRALALETVDGKWEVMLCGYSEHSDPLMHAKGGSA